MCLFLFVSCKSMYSPIEDISHITQKKSMRPFSSLNDPIVITMPVYQKMGLMGGTADVRSKRQGDIFVVYDWESGTVYDWACFLKETTVFPTGGQWRWEHRQNITMQEKPVR